MSRCFFAMCSLEVSLRLHHCVHTRKIVLQRNFALCLMLSLFLNYAIHDCNVWDLKCRDGVNQCTSIVHSSEFIQTTFNLLRDWNIWAPWMLLLTACTTWDLWVEADTNKLIYHPTHSGWALIQVFSASACGFSVVWAFDNCVNWNSSMRVSICACTKLQWAKYSWHIGLYNQVLGYQRDAECWAKTLSC